MDDVFLVIGGNRSLIENNIGVNAINGGLELTSIAYNITVNNNSFCSGTIKNYDFWNMGINNTGDNNTCDTADNWNDDGTNNCTFLCSDCIKCLSCLDCNEKLINHNYVCLINNILNESGNCIIFESLSNKIFNCDNYFINSTIDLGSGVLINNSYDISIFNCVISNFQNGIKIQNSTINDVENNILCDNWEWDIIDWNDISYGKNNTATDIYNFLIWVLKIKQHIYVKVMR